MSKLTGVSCHALRVWERRYGFPLPDRTASGHRRYGIDQVFALRRLTELAQQNGTSIGDLIGELKQNKIKVESASPLVADEPDESDGLSDLLDRLISGDLKGGDVLFERFQQKLIPEELIEKVIAPALTETGERWFRRRCAIYQERCATGYLRRKLDAMIDLARKENTQPGTSVIVGAVQGERHEGGLLVINFLLEKAGWRVVNLGVDLPVSEFARAVEQLKPDALAISFVLSRNVNKRFEELSRINHLPIFVGGRSILNYQGLARRYGLIPLTGPINIAIEQLGREFREWSARQGMAQPPRLDQG